MSQTYKFKSLSIVNNDKTKDDFQEDENLNVFTLGESKTIDFRLKDGSRQSFFYSHFITAWTDKEDELQLIKIFFSPHLVTIKGYCLVELYDHLIQHMVRNITEHDERYASMVDENNAFVTEIDIAWKSEGKEF